MDFWYYARLKILRHRRELQFQFPVSIIHWNAFLFHSLDENPSCQTAPPLFTQLGTRRLICLQSSRHLLDDHLLWLSHLFPVLECLRYFLLTLLVVKPAFWRTSWMLLRKYNSIFPSTLSFRNCLLRFQNLHEFRSVSLSITSTFNRAGSQSEESICAFRIAWLKRASGRAFQAHFLSLGS